MPEVSGALGPMTLTVERGLQHIPGEASDISMQKRGVLRTAKSESVCLSVCLFIACSCQSEDGHRYLKEITNSSSMKMVHFPKIERRKTKQKESNC